MTNTHVSRVQEFANKNTSFHCRSRKNKNDARVSFQSWQLIKRNQSPDKQVMTIVKALVFCVFRTEFTQRCVHPDVVSIFELESLSVFCPLQRGPPYVERGLLSRRSWLLTWFPFLANFCNLLRNTHKQEMSSLDEKWAGECGVHNHYAAASRTPLGLFCSVAKSGPKIARRRENNVWSNPRNQHRCRSSCLPNQTM